MVNKAKIKKTMKSTKVFLAALMILAATACTKQEINDSKDSQEIKPAENVVLVPMSFSASGEEVDGVRATIDNSGSPLKILWESTDAVKVYDNIAPSTPHDFSVTPGTPATAATLEGEVAEGSASFYAVYPAAAAAGIDGGTLTVTVPAAQVIPSGKNIDPAAIVSVASAAKGDALSFKNVCGFLALEVSYANIQSITVSGTKIAGSASVAGATGVISSNASATNSITLTHEDGLFPLGVYYIALLPGETAVGDFVVDMTQDVAGFTATRTATSAVDIPRNGGFDFGKLDSKVNWTYLISSAADMVAWRNRYSEWQATDVVRLTDDIDMDGVNDWEPAQEFHGSFEGDNHKIYNFVMSRSSGNICFINHMFGIFRNVTFGSSNGTTWDGVSTFTLTGDKDGSWHYSGIIGRLRSSVSYVNSFIKYVVKSDCPKKTRMGGIVGVTPDDDLGAAQVIDHCNFYGVLSAEYSGGKTDNTLQIYMGGILANSDNGQHNPVISNCKNYGTLQSVDKYTSYVGGIIGVVTAGHFAEIVDCENHGDITYETSARILDAFVGGIAGYMHGNKLAGNSLTRCKNYSDFDMNSSNVRYYGGIIGCGNSVVISYCENHGDVKMTNSDLTSSQLLVGGIGGYILGLSSVDHCTNEGTVESRKNQVSNVGGICGAVRNGNSAADKDKIIVSNCENTGECKIYRTATNANWQACGGIVGQQESSSADIKNNVNSGPVSIDVVNTTTHAGGLSVGGILGLGYTSLAESTCALSGNVNTGSVTLSNSGASAMIHSAGGIIGRTLNNQITSTGDTANCAVSRTVGGTATGATGAAVGYNEGGIITNPVLGGSVDGVALTAENVATKAIGSGTAAVNPTLYVAP